MIEIAARTQKGCIAPMPYPIMAVANLVLGTLFVGAAIGKMRSKEIAFSSVSGYLQGVLPSHVLGSIAVALPFGELSLGLFLLTGIYARVVAMLTATLLCVFTALLIRRLLHGEVFRCNCFGANSTVSGLGGALRNVFMLAITLFVAVWPYTQNEVVPWFASPLHHETISDLIITFTLAASLFLSAEIIAELPALFRSSTGTEQR